MPFVPLDLSRPVLASALVATISVLAKADMLLLDLNSTTSHQFELDLQEPSASASEKGRSRTQLMQTLDGINRRYGRGTVQLASAGLKGKDRTWSMRQERKTPGYTTRWDELAVVRA